MHNLFESQIVGTELNDLEYELILNKKKMLSVVFVQKKSTAKINNFQDKNRNY